MTRKLRTASAALLAALVWAVFGVPPAHAAVDNWYGNRLVYGIGGGGQAYWISSTASSHTSSIDAAMQNWINTSSRLGVRTPLYWSKTTTKSAARLEVHAIVAPTASYCALTYHYRSGALVTPWVGPNRNWVWGKFDIHTNVFNTSACPNRQGIISHEMGHVFGLSHNDNASTLMYRNIAWDSNVHWATVDEANRINSLY